MQNHTVDLFNQRKVLSQKEDVFLLLKHNYHWKIFEKRSSRLNKIIFFVKLEALKIKVMAQRRAYHFRRKMIRFSVKRTIIAWNKFCRNKSLIISTFRKMVLTIKVFKLLISYILHLRLEQDKKVIEFKESFLKIKLLNMLSKNQMIHCREKSLIMKIEEFNYERKMNLIKNCIDDWKRYYICERYRRTKMLQKIIKVFYVLKFDTINELDFTN